MLVREDVAVIVNAPRVNAIVFLVFYGWHHAKYAIENSMIERLTDEPRSKSGSTMAQRWRMTGQSRKRPRPPLDGESLEQLALFYVGRATQRRAQAAYLSDANCGSGDGRKTVARNRKGTGREICRTWLYRRRSLCQFACGFARAAWLWREAGRAGALCRRYRRKRWRRSPEHCR